MEVRSIHVPSTIAGLDRNCSHWFFVVSWTKLIMLSLTTDNDDEDDDDVAAAASRRRANMMVRLACLLARFACADRWSTVRELLHDRVRKHEQKKEVE